MCSHHQVLAALRRLRVPIQQGEYDLHVLVAEALRDAGLNAAHEVRLGPRCRIDFLCGDVGIEIKRGRVERTAVFSQLSRYASSGQVQALILVTERTLSLPDSIAGKPLFTVCLNRLWGIAL